MKPRIYLVFVDDWELRGDGSGDITRLQFGPMRELVKIYNAYGTKGSFNVEVMQQLTFRIFQDEHPELKMIADEWDSVVRETLSQGHDIQLHIHPQWSKAEWKDGKWHLTADWSILKYDPNQAYEMMVAGKQYLENLLRPISPSYRCVTFRSGSWCIAPSPHILGLLVKLGIVFDMSIVGGVRYDTRNVTLNYTDCEEDFLPYYPVMTDARRISDKPEEIICVPTNHFYESRLHLLQNLGRAKLKISQRIKRAAPGASSDEAATSYFQEWEPVKASFLNRVWEKGIKPYWTGKHFISDLAQLDYSLLLEMLRSIRQRASRSGLPEVPIVLENHTKDIQNFSHIERFVKDVSQAPDIQCLTLSELASELKKGRFQIRTAQRK